MKTKSGGQQWESCLPSTMTYRDRLSLKADDPHAYSMLYSFQRQQGGDDVYGRLTGDAAGRQLRSAQGPRPGKTLPWPGYQSVNETFYSKGNLSGFVTNTSRAVYTHSTFRTGHQNFGDRVNFATLSPPQLKRFKAREPYDYAAQIRPDAETTSQTMRMLGTYESDYAAAQRSGVFIPNSCPGGGPWFHPDVRVTGQAAEAGTAPHRYTTRPHTVLGFARTV